MKVGDLVRFKGSDLVIGVVVTDDGVTPHLRDPLRNLGVQVGIVWLNAFEKNVTFQPVSHLEVVSESR